MRILTTCTIVAAFCVLAAAPGCAGPLSCCPCKTNCAPPCEDPAAIVTVGGHVHEPRQLEIGSNGLTLRNALLAAGGSREQVQVQETTSNPGAVAKLQDLVVLRREIGRLQAQQSVYSAIPDKASKFIPRSAKELNDDFNAKRLTSNAMIIDLSTEFEESDVRVLSGHSGDVSKFRMILELLNNPEFRELTKDLPNWQPGLNTDLLNQSTAEEAAVMEMLLDKRGKTTLRSLQSELLVTLSRPAAEAPATYYFPYDVVVAGLASEIPLQDGDVISVVDVRETDLMPPDPERWSGGSTVAIQGYLESTGVAEKITTFGNVHASSEPLIDDPRSVWMLVRPGIAGQSQQIFVLPDRMVEANGAAVNAPAREGDFYTYTILPQVPIVLESLVSHTVEAEKCKVLREMQEMKAQCEARRQSRFERACGSVSKHFKCFSND